MNKKLMSILILAIFTVGSVSLVDAKNKTDGQTTKSTDKQKCNKECRKNKRNEKNKDKKSKSKKDKDAGKKSLFSNN